MKKLADLLPGVKLQPHQQHIADEAGQSAIRKLLVHGLGSGKTLTSIAAMERHGTPYSAVVPAALRENYRKEMAKFTNQAMPADVQSYDALATGGQPGNPGALVFDEAHRLRNPTSARSQAAMALARKAQQVLLLSGTPIVNRPGDLAVPMSMLTGKDITPEGFEKRYVGNKKVYPSFFHRLFGASAGEEPTIEHEKELRSLLKGHVDYYQPEKPVVPVNYEDHAVEMGKEQTQLYRAMWDELPWWLRWKLKNDFPLSADELKRMTSFLTGPRQVGLSTLPYQRSKNPIKAFDQSPKLQKAFGLMQEDLKDPRTKALVFSNFVDAGLGPYAAALGKAGVPHAVFHGGLSDTERRKLVEAYNDGKIRVALVAPSGTEGLSFKGTQLIQILDPYWNPVRGKQSVGRGLRFDSHMDLPEDLQKVRVQRFSSRLPLGFKDRLLRGIGMDRTQNQYAADDYLTAMAKRKDQRNQVFMNLLKDVGTEKEAVARWRMPERLAQLAKRLQPAIGRDPKAMTAGDLKVLLGQQMRGQALSPDPVVTSATRLPGAGPVMSGNEAMSVLGRQEPSLLRRVLEGTGMAQEGNYPGFRAQPVPFTGRAMASIYGNAPGQQPLNIMHVAPRLGGARKYFTHAEGPLPGHAFIGAATLPPATKFYPHGGGRASAMGLPAKPISRHGIDAYEAVVPPKVPETAFLGSQKPGGEFLDVSKIAPAKMENWFNSYVQDTDKVRAALAAPPAAPVMPAALKTAMEKIAVGANARRLAKLQQARASESPEVMTKRLQTSPGLQKLLFRPASDPILNKIREHYGMPVSEGRLTPTELKGVVQGMVQAKTPTPQTPLEARQEMMAKARTMSQQLGSGEMNPTLKAQLLKSKMMQSQPDWQRVEWENSLKAHVPERLHRGVNRLREMQDYIKKGLPVGDYKPTPEVQHYFDRVNKLHAAAGARADAIALSGRHGQNVIPISDQLASLSAEPTFGYKGYKPKTQTLGELPGPVLNPNKGTGFWVSGHPEVGTNYAMDPAAGDPRLPGYLSRINLKPLEQYGPTSPRFHTHQMRDTRDWSPLGVEWLESGIPGMALKRLGLPGLAEKYKQNQPLRPGANQTWGKSPFYEKVYSWPSYAGEAVPVKQYSDAIYKALPSGKGMQQIYGQPTPPAAPPVMPEALKVAAAAKGIPDRSNYGDPSTLPVGKLIDFVTQRHDARRAGTHTDVRMGTPEMGLHSWAARKGLPTPGKKHLAVHQPLHEHGYKSFQGDIPEGYGAGKVTRERDEQVLITKATPDRIQFTTGGGRYPERFTMVKPRDGKNWLLMNTTPTQAIPYEKKPYTKVPKEKAEEVLKKLQPGSSVQAKIDGAASLTTLFKNKAEILSYRTSKVTGGPLTHTERIFKGRPYTTLPKALQNTILRGEIYGMREGKAIPPQELGGLLNSSLAKSLASQQEKGTQLRNMVFDVERLGGKSTADMPYQDRLARIPEILKHLPSDVFHGPEVARTPAEALALWKRVSSGQHPLTNEGLVVHRPTGRPQKIKLTDEHDVFVRDIFPGLGKYKGMGAGGFQYSHGPTGPIAGKVGTGLSDELRRDMLADPAAYQGRMARVQAQSKLPSGALRAPALLSLHEDYPVAKTAVASPLQVLLQAKAESDRKNYRAKTQLLRDLIKLRQQEFVIDSEQGPFVGITHAPTNFRIHMKRKDLPVELPPALLPALA